MSAIIEKAKKEYKLAFIAELLIFFVVFLTLFLWQRNIAISFGLGALSAVLPHGFFTFFVFAKKYSVDGSLKAFYCGEAIKFLLTIILIIGAFKLFLLMNFIAFFMGYFLALLLNNLLPFLVRRYIKFNLK